jgi:hypothetical protein
VSVKALSDLLRDLAAVNVFVENTLDPNSSPFNTDIIRRERNRVPSGAELSRSPMKMRDLLIAPSQTLRAAQAEGLIVFNPDTQTTDFDLLLV